MEKAIYLYVVPFFPSQNSWRGGFFYDAVKALMRDGRYDIKVMSTGSKGDYEIDGINVFGVGTWKIGASDYFSSITDVLKLRLFAKKLKSMGLYASDVAVCHVHLLDRMAIYAEWIKKRNANCLTILHHHLTGMSYPRRSKLHWIFPFSNELAYLRCRRSYGAVDLHLFCSELTKQSFGKVVSVGTAKIDGDIRKCLKFSRLLPALRYNKGIVLYNGVDERQFNPNANARNDSLYKIGCVGNFIHTKGQILLVEAFAKISDSIPQARLYFIGSGNTLRQCEDRVMELNLGEKVVFLKECLHSEIHYFYQSLDLYVLPSFWEAFNCSLIEALYCGVPVIAMDNISFKEVLTKEDQDRWLVPLNDINALAEKIVWVYNESPLPQVLTKNLNIDVITTSLLDTIDSMRSGQESI